MIPPLTGPALGNVMQIAWVTPGRPVAYVGFVEGARFCYADERDTMGCYFEYVGFSPEIAAQMKPAIPTCSFC
jgi:hypothetical protein